MRAVVFGCQRICIDVLEYLKTQPIMVAAVITQDEPRDYLFSDISVSDYCAKNNINYTRFNGPVDESIIKSFNPDVGFSLYYRRILSKNIIDLFPRGIFNLHPAVLPHLRGPNPTLWALKNGEVYSGITLHMLDAGMDTGDVIAQYITTIGDRNGFELNRDIMDLGVELFKDNFESLINSTYKAQPQDNSLTTCCVPFRDNFRYINWQETQAQIIRHIKCFEPPYSGSLCWNDKGTYVINKAEPLNIERGNKGPGSFVEVDGSLIIQTGNRPIKIISSTIDLKKGRFISGVP